MLQYIRRSIHVGVSVICVLGEGVVVSTAHEKYTVALSWGKILSDLLIHQLRPKHIPYPVYYMTHMLVRHRHISFRCL